MTTKKYRVHDFVKFQYSEIGEYVDENHTDKPLRNDEIVDLLNEQHEIIEQFTNIARKCNIPYDKLCDAFEKSIDWDCETDCKINAIQILKENEQLKFQLKECREHKLYSRRKLEKENEQLKKEIISLNVELDTHKHPLWSTREAERIVNELKQENEQLKQQREELFIRERDTKNDWRELKKKNNQLRNRLNDWHQRTFKAHEYFNILEKVIDEVCDDDISNQIWKEYEKREKLIE